MVLMALGLAAIVYRARKRFAMLEPDSALIVAMYLVALWFLYQHRPA
jgi:cation:H+ antiporter